MSKVSPGTYKAKIIGYGLIEGNHGDQVMVEFALDNGLKYRWYGKLATEKNQEYTIKDLFTLGANKDNFTKVKGGIASGVLNANKEYEVVIQDRKHLGKTYTEIKYINDPSVPRNSYAPKPAQGNSLDGLKGVAAQIAAETGMGKKENSLPTEPTFTSEDVPF